MATLLDGLHPSRVLILGRFGTALDIGRDRAPLNWSDMLSYVKSIPRS